MQSDGGNRLTEGRRALIARYMVDAPEQPAGAEREEPMRREALEAVARRAAFAHERTRREAEERVAQRVALASVTEEARRKAADERMRREALEEVARRAADAEAYANREADEDELGVVTGPDAADPMPRRVRDARHDRHLLAGERVDERRLADVRPSGDRDEAGPQGRSQVSGRSSPGVAVRISPSAPR